MNSTKKVVELNKPQFYPMGLKYQTLKSENRIIIDFLDSEKPSVGDGIVMWTKPVQFGIQNFEITEILKTEKRPSGKIWIQVKAKRAL